MKNIPISDNVAWDDEALWRSKTHEFPHLILRNKGNFTHRILRITRLNVYVNHDEGQIQLWNSSSSKIIPLSDPELFDKVEKILAEIE
jgi:hypothetical protein